MTLTCPYCEKDFKEPVDGQKPGERYYAECAYCNNSFAYEIELDIVTTSYKAACLNGGEHEWTTQTCCTEFMYRRVCPCGESEDIYNGQERQNMADAYFKSIKRDL